MNVSTWKQAVATSLVTAALLVIVGCAGNGNTRSTGETLDDASIATRLKASLLADSMTDGLEIDVEVDRGRVQLNGFTDSDEEIEKAGEIAESIEGVVSVDNNLRVSDGARRTGQYIDDTTLTAKIKAALIDNQDVNAVQVDVEVNNGKVSLGGFVDSNMERREAVKTARDVNGTRSVIDNMTVR